MTSIARSVRTGVVAAALAMLLETARLQAATIERVTIKPAAGSGPVPEAMIRVNIRSQEGQVFSEEVLSSDIQRLYETGQFSDVQFQIERPDPNRVAVTLIVAPKPRVRTIVIEGNKEVKTKTLRKLVQHAEGAILKETQVATDANALRKKYQDKGYYQTRVTTLVQAIPNTNEVNLVFRVREEPRQKISSVEFRGNTVFTGRELRKAMQTKFSWWSLVFSTGYLDEDRLDLDQDLVRERYTRKGYLDFRVVDIARQPNRSGSRVTLTVTVDEGQPYTVESVKVTGTERFSADELEKGLRLRPGTGPLPVYDSELSEADVRRMKAKYEELGYLDLVCVTDLRTDSSRHTVAVDYRFREGRPCHVRDVYITGNEVTQDRVIRRELDIQPGDLGDAGKIRTSRSRLMNMNYFENVEITPTGTEKEDEKDLLINVAEKHTGQLMVGAGFSSEDDAIGMLEVTQSNFDYRNWPRFTGAGQRLRLRLHAGTEMQNFGVTFTEPWWLDRPLRLDLDLFYNERDQDQYVQQSAGAGVKVTHPLWQSKAKEWPWLSAWRQYYGYRVAQTTLSDFDTVSPELLTEEGSYLSSTLLMGVYRDTRDRWLNPSTGSKVSLDLELAPSMIGSYADLYRVGVEGSKYYPLVLDCVFKVGAELGVVDAVGDEDVAIFDRYFAGGAYSIRGFKRREVGPIYDDVPRRAPPVPWGTTRPSYARPGDDPKGGKSLFRGTFEIIYPIYDRIHGSVFTDYGNVWEGSAAWDPTDVNVSVGAGLQIDLPIGPIRLDYGIPVVRQYEHLGKGGRLHFQIGYMF